MRVGVITSTPLEAKVFGVTMKHGCVEQIGETIIVCCGPGRKGVDRSMLHLTYMDVDCIVSWGFAGGLVTTMPTGSLIIPKQIIHPVGPTLDTSKTWHQKIIQTLPQDALISTDPIMHSDVILKTKQEKDFSHERTRACAVDQESFYVALWARQLDLPMISIRVVLDDLNTHLPDAIASILQDNGQINKKALMKVIANPIYWPDLLKLQSQYKISQQQLQAVAQHQNPFQ